MITKKSYLQAKKIVEEYETQQSNTPNVTKNREDINKQAFLLMTNITGVKIKTNIGDKHHETLMNSFIILMGMFNDFINEKELEK